MKNRVEVFAFFESKRDKFLFEVEIRESSPKGRLADFTAKSQFIFENSVVLRIR